METTTTTTTVAPQTSDCTTIDGPGVGKACMPFTYGSHRISYDGCINRAPPAQSVSEVFGEFSTDFSDSGAISFGVAPRRRVSGLRPRHGEEDMVFRSLFWCATDADTSGYVKEWGKCNVGCKADPAGSYVPAAPRRGTSTSRGFSHSLRGQTVGQLSAIIRAANQRTRPRGPN